MRKLFYTCLTIGLCATSAHAQTLITYGSHSVSKDEFLRVYKKNSINKKPDMSDTAIKSYLDLYALFRMKVAEADKQRLDTVPSITSELDNYRKQLAKNYLTDEQVTNKLIHEAYDRMKQNVRVEHILISCTPGSDTVAAYRKIDSIYHQIESVKTDFETMAKTYSDDKGSKENGGDIGYFTSMQTVYPFENMAYGTPVGKISRPFKTQFGYHIVKVLDKRADRGQVKVAQIMVMTPKSKGEEGVAAAKLRADSIEVMIKHGIPFGDLVAQYSEDQYSVKDSGVLKPFGAGRMVLAFENAAFELKKPGDVFAPIKTEYGYHIIKLINKIPLAPYDTIFPQLKHKVENDSRAQTAKDRFFEKIKEKNGFKQFNPAVSEVEERLMAIPDTGKTAKTIVASDYKNLTRPVFVLAGRNYLQSDFVVFLEKLTHGKLNGPKNAVIHDGFNMYINYVVNDFEEHKLVDENPEFKNLMEEYRDGIMLFELMDRNVWSKAAHDSAGLAAFYDGHRSKYMWEPGFEGGVYKFKTRPLLDSGIAMLRAGNVSDEEMVKEINTSTHPDGVSIQRGRYEFSRFHDATQADLSRDKIKVVLSSSAPFTVVVAKEVFNSSGQKSLNEARGYVVAEYQDYLEKQWNEKMRKEYPLTVKQAVLKTLSKK
jgi:peptidyl-prolyl cis-trans isomerase SurA